MAVLLHRKIYQKIPKLHQDSTKSFPLAIRALQWVPMNFFPKIPEIDLRRFSLQFSLGVIVAIHEKLEKFHNISIEDLSENLQYLEKRFQCDNAVHRNKCRNNEAFSRYASYH